MATVTIDFFDHPTAHIYQLLSYPDGALQVRIRPEWIDTVRQADEVVVRACLTTPQTMLHTNTMGLLLLTDALRELNPTARFTLYLPYLPYSRGDRRFTEGDCDGLSTYGKVLSVGMFDNIFTLDVHHGTRARNAVPQIACLSPTIFIHRAIQDFAALTGDSSITLLYPDDGAAHRYRVPSPQERIRLAIATASKTRNPVTGALDGFTIAAAYLTRAVLIIDDICDGGRTFLGMADAIRTHYGGDHILGLYVTHGIFSQGLTILTSRFARIYTTDSIAPRRSYDQLAVYRAYDAYPAEVTA